MLWFDFAFSPQDRELRVASARFFRVTYVTRVDKTLQDIARLDPSALCFEFDQVDQERLQMLQDVMRAYPRLPVLMLSVDHSEALAVWAFRAGVWNYLVKPVPVVEFAANLEALRQLVAAGAQPRTPRPPDTRALRDLSTAPSDVRVTRLQPALQYVRRHFHEKITETEAARRCGLRRFAFSRSFHDVFGLTFREYVMRSRIGEARRLLAEGGHTVTEVAQATGFGDSSYFARAFREHVGVPPSEYGQNGRL